MPLTPGARLGPYEIIAPLGAGGMGEVYRARDTRLDRTVAIKVLPEHLAADAEARQRFEREARAVSSLNHPNICVLHDIGHQDGVDFLVMEYLEGETLAERLAKGALPLDQALGCAIQIADALDKAHRRGVTHRDLKPGNIILTKNGAKLLDFGLAKVGGSPRALNTAETVLSASPHNAATLTQRGTVLGTFQYMSPEQVEGHEADARSDIFAFGAVLYEMLTGRKAFEGKSPASLMAAILAADPPPVATLQPMTPAALDRVVRTCLAKDPDDRWQSAADLKREVKWIASAPESHAPERLNSRLRHKAKLPWIAAGAVALIAAFAGWGWWRATQPVETTPQPLVRLDLDLGADVLLGPSIGPAVILSPDGTRLVFVSLASDGTSRLFTRRLDQPKAVPLSGTEGADAPFFSPNGQWVGFFARGKLKKTRIDGGEPVSLCDAPAGRGASWGEDGNIIAALDTQVGLAQVPPEGGKAISITELAPGENSHRWPQVLPGGKAALFIASTRWGNYDEAAIAVVSLKGRRRKTVLEPGGMYPRYLPSGHLVYVTKGTLFAAPFDLDRLEVRGAATLLQEVSSDPTFGSAQIDFSRGGTIAYRTGRTEGLRTLQWLDAAGKTVPLGTEPAVYLFPRLSPDGNRLAFVVSQGSSTDLWVHDLQRGSKTRLTSGIVAGNPVWSPDGRFVVFEAAGGMFWTLADGAGEPQPLTQSKTVQLPSSFTPDGRRLIFSELTPGGGSEIRTVPVQGSSGRLRAGESQLFLKVEGPNTDAAFSPDGRWLAYADAEAGSYDVYVRAFPDRGVKVLISNDGGMMPVWSRNGHELFYRTEDNRIMVVNYTVKEESFVADKPRVWSGKQLANIGTAPSYDLAPDGKRFVVLMPAEGPEPREAQSHVMLGLNFFDEVRRRVAASGK